MPSLPRPIYVAQTVLDKAPGAFDAGRGALESAKPAITSALEVGTYVSNSALAYGKPLAQTTFDSGKNALAPALSHLKPDFSQLPSLRDMINALLANLKALLSSGLEAGKRFLNPIIPFLLTLMNLAWDKIRQHPLVSAAATVYALLCMAVGPLWPLAVVLKILGFGVKGVALGAYIFMCANCGTS
jgi:hypothetical protein